MSLWQADARQAKHLELVLMRGCGSGGGVGVGGGGGGGGGGHCEGGKPVQQNSVEIRSKLETWQQILAPPVCTDQQGRPAV